MVLSQHAIIAYSLICNNQSVLMLQTKKDVVGMSLNRRETHREKDNSKKNNNKSKSKKHLFLMLCLCVRECECLCLCKNIKCLRLRKRWMRLMALWIVNSAEKFEIFFYHISHESRLHWNGIIQEPATFMTQNSK